MCKFELFGVLTTITYKTQVKLATFKLAPSISKNGEIDTDIYFLGKG